MKAAFIAIIGAPNAGKSTLLNQIIGSKISIVTPKVQTTRSTLKAIYVQDETQLVFVDTPGIFTPKRTLEKAIVETAWSGLEGIDQVLVIIDAIKGFCENLEIILERLQSKKITPILVINKIDIITKEKLSRTITEAKNRFTFKEIFTISALMRDGVEELLNYLSKEAPEHEWYFPEDQLTTTPMRVIASEITREKLFLSLADELPYNLTVETETWEQQKNGSIKINQVIYVSKDTHKQIILGYKGEMIKTIGILARKNIEEIFENKVHLFLFVKVRENWTKDPERYKYLDMQLPTK